MSIQPWELSSSKCFRAPRALHDTSLMGWSGSFTVMCVTHQKCRSALPWLVTPSFLWYSWELLGRRIDREQMTMRKCISSAPDQPRLVLTEKRMLMGRQRDELPFPKSLGLDKPGEAQNSGVLLGSFFTVPEVRMCQQVGWWAAQSNWVSTWGVRKRRRGK